MARKATQLSNGATSGSVFSGSGSDTDMRISESLRDYVLHCAAYDNAAAVPR